MQPAKPPSSPSLRLPSLGSLTLLEVWLPQAPLRSLPRQTHPQSTGGIQVARASLPVPHPRKLHLHHRDLQHPSPSFPPARLPTGPPARPASILSRLLRSNPGIFLVLFPKYPLRQRSHLALNAASKTWVALGPLARCRSRLFLSAL